jgi:ferredoxin-type protein NapH
MHQATIQLAAPMRRALLRNRWLLARRCVQLTLLGLFMLGPWLGMWVARGTLASSDWLGLLQLTDPLVAVQALVARHAIGPSAIVGATIVAVAYLLFGGRSYCAWVCPINPVTDLAAWLRVRLGLPTLLQRLRPDRRLRLVVLAMALALSAALGAVAWEAINPITLLHRALVFGLAGGYGAALAVFLFDLLILPRGWCGHLCPVGAFYGLLGHLTPLRISAVKRDACTKCGDCFKVCPEPHVIAPVLYGAPRGIPPTIDSSDCVRCGRCIEQCDEDVFSFVVKVRRTGT